MSKYFHSCNTAIYACSGDSILAQCCIIDVLINRNLKDVMILLYWIHREKKAPEDN